MNVTVEALFQSAIAIIATLGIGSVFGTWLIRVFQRGRNAELEATLSSSFATTQAVQALARDLNQWGEKVNATLKLAEVATQNADLALDKADAVERRVADQQERISERNRETAEVLKEVTHRIEQITIWQAKRDAVEEDARNRRRGDPK